MKKLYRVTLRLESELYIDMSDIDDLDIDDLAEYEITDIEFEEIDDDELEIRKGDALYDMISGN